MRCFWVAEMQFKDVLTQKFMRIHLSALCILLVVQALACKAVLGSTTKSDCRAEFQDKFGSHPDCWPSGTASGLALKQSSWYSGTAWTAPRTGSGVVCPAQLLPYILAILAQASCIMIQDRLDYFPKGARHSPAEEKMTFECNLNSSQVFAAHRNTA